MELELDKLKDSGDELGCSRHEPDDMDELLADKQDRSDGCCVGRAVRLPRAQSRRSTSSIDGNAQDDVGDAIAPCW